jgi:hypothetical protein
VDSSNWIEHSSGSLCQLYDVAFGNGVFVAVGNEGAVITSPDGVCWIARNARTDERLRGIVFGNGIFVAVGYEGAIVTSRTGLSGGFEMLARHSDYKWSRSDVAPS